MDNLDAPCTGFALDKDCFDTEAGLAGPIETFTGPMPIATFCGPFDTGLGGPIETFGGSIVGF